jgi:hypothetical protein
MEGTMDWLIDLATTHWVPPWWTHGYLVGSLFSFAAGMGLLQLLRWKRDPKRKMYLTPWVASWIGELICFPALMGYVAEVYDHETPEGFYTQVWFYVVLFLIVYPTMVLAAKARAKQEEADGRDPVISTWPSERFHTYGMFPVMICMLAWSIFPTVHYHPWDIIQHAVPFAVIWAVAFLIDEHKEDRPKSVEDWTSRFFVTTTIGVIAYRLVASYA